MIVLGIETSCDETAAAVYDGKLLLSNVINTQIIHKKYGGVVPELASREHLNNIIPVVDEAFSLAEVDWNTIEAVAVTQGPGLIGSLLVGISFAKAAAFSRNVRIIGVNHIEAHLWVPAFEYPGLRPPYIGLIVSGGHTQLWWVKGFGDYVLIGQTLDDAAGEAFDKVAQMLGLEYPGGPVIDRLSRAGDPAYYNFPRPFLKNGSFDFSFSGLKTSVLYFLEKLSDGEINDHKADIAASFQQAVIDTLVEKTYRAAETIGVGTVIIGGGVAANTALNKRMTARAREKGLHFICPSTQFCTDNAAMIAYVGKRYLEMNKTSDFSFSAHPSLKLSEAVYHPIEK